ncbi:L-rhamnose/proton symporter RhaT [Shigella boydii]
MTHQLDAAYELLCIAWWNRRVAPKEWNDAGRCPVTVLSLGCVVIIVAANIVGIGTAN